MVTPKDRLLGLTVGNGWLVTKICTRNASDTGGNFSTGYIAEKGNEKAFVKAMDLTRALLESSEKQLNAIRFVVDMIQFEGAVLKECTNNKLSRVVRLIESSTVQLENSTTDPIVQASNTVHLLIFELGAADVRKQLGTPTANDSSIRLNVLHNVATALQQLHKIGIAHQDIKPSNVLAFPNKEHKVTDLGRASIQGHASPLDGEIFPGDPLYSPPEFAYGHIPSDNLDRRFAADAYMLGSLIAFLFCFQGTTSLLQGALPDHLLPPKWQRNANCPAWTGSFEDILPYLKQAMARVESYIEPNLPDFCRRELKEAFSQLSNASPYDRGNPATRYAHGRLIGLDRYVSLFDRLSKKAELIESIANRSSK